MEFLIMNFKSTLQAISIIGLMLISSVTLATSTVSSKLLSIEANEFKQSYSTIKVHSVILNEDREILVHLPDDYETSNKRYPVLYVLDGNRHLPHAVLTETILQEESLMPQSIIVAIKNNRGTRGRDLSASRENFLRFIKDEVFSLITKQYRTSAHKTLFGHSMAGAFTMSVLASQPNMFDNYIAASPTIQSNDYELIAQYQALDLTKTPSQISLYLTFGNEAAEGKIATEALHKFLNLMEKITDEKLLWRFHALPEQVHMTTPYLTLYAGLSFAFSDFKAPTYTGLADYRQRGELKGLKDYYAKRASKYLVSNEVPDETFVNLGFAIFDEGHKTEGLEILKTTAKLYPDSFRALNALAQTYEDVKKTSRALAVYKKAVLLAEKRSSRNLNFFKRHVERLQQSNSTD